MNTLNWKYQRDDWERRIEDILIEVIKYKLPDGRMIPSNPLPMMQAWDGLIGPLEHAVEVGNGS